MEDPYSELDDTKLTTSHSESRSRAESKRPVRPKPKNNLEAAEIWCSSISDGEMKDYCHTIDLNILWPFLFTQNEKPDRYIQWAFTAQFIDEEDYDVLGLTMDKLDRVELLESVMRFMKKRIQSTKFVSCLLDLLDKTQKAHCNLDGVIDMIEKTGEFNSLRGEVNFKRRRLRMTAIAICCFQYAFCVKMVAIDNESLLTLKNYLGSEQSQKSEEYKTKGNEEFNKGNYSVAVSLYCKAIDISPVNEILYGNRALCFLRIEDYKSALGDGKRATLIKSDWPKSPNIWFEYSLRNQEDLDSKEILYTFPTKGHYRFCTALFLMGEYQRAIIANITAQSLCQQDQDGFLDLVQQKKKFIRRQHEASRDCGKPRTDKLKKEMLAKTTDGGQVTELSSQESNGVKDACKHKKDSKVLVQKDVEKCVTNNKQHGSVTDLDADQDDKTGRSTEDAAVKGQELEIKAKDFSKGKTERKSREQLNQHVCPHGKSYSKRSQERNESKTPPQPAPEKMLVSLNDSTCLVDKLRALVQDGHMALSDHRCRNAEHDFLQALNLLDPTKLKEISLSTIDYVVLIYGRALALLGIGHPKELSEAENQFNHILMWYSEERFGSLAFYGLGRVYFKQNRFADALDPFTKSLTMVNRKIVPGILTWPKTTVIIEETDSARLKIALEEYIGKCQFPPKSDAICRYQQYQSHIKVQIYFSDPDFKGFIRVMCYLKCKVEYHINCWKKLKSVAFADKNDKDFLKSPCFTPDCGGKISKIFIFSSKGLVKCEFEAKMVINTEPAKAVIKQKCSSAFKLRIKEERKIRRKQLRKEAIRLVTERRVKESHANVSKGEEAKLKMGLPPSRCAHRDWMLQLVSEKQEQLRIGVQDISGLLPELLSSHVLSEEDSAALSASACDPQEAMGKLVDLIVCSNNRVQTRLFLYALTKCQGVDNKLLEWINRLNNTSLKATELFISRYSHCIEGLDIAPLLEVLDEAGINLPSEELGTEQVVETLKQSSPVNIRTFIWILEKNRKNFPSLHNPLDEYFNVMEAPCITLKKQENEELSNIGPKSKIRNRKKLKDPKPLHILTGMFSTGGHEEEDEEIFSDDGNLGMWMNPMEPFMVPEYLHDQLREFENNRDPTRESLYDYFFQILEEHGPLALDDPLLLSEFENFPAETRELVSEAGGLRPFLLDNLRFAMISGMVGLMEHAVTMKITAAHQDPAEISSNPPRPVAYLNPAAKEFKPISSQQIPVAFPLTDYPLTDEEHFNSHFSTDQTTDTTIDNVYYCINPYSDLKSGVLEPHSSICPEANHYLFPPTSLPGTDSSFCILPTSRSSPVIPVCAIGQDVPNYNYVFDSLNDQEGPGSGSYNDGTGQWTTPSDEASIISLLEGTFAPLGPNPESKRTNGDAEESNSASNQTNSGCKPRPLLRTIGVQVYQESINHVKVNTDPFQPFEDQQGDILRIEKEHKVLQEQLREAEEKYNQLSVRSLEEVTALEAEVTQRVQKNELLKSDLQSLRQAVESEAKRGQLERRENQENLKLLKSKSKELTKMNETYRQNTEERIQIYEKSIEEFGEISIQNSAEKIKLEEVIKKNHQTYQNITKRAAEAEVSVLQNWQRIGLFFHHRAAEDAQSHLKRMKAVASSDHSSAAPQSVAAWETFLLQVNTQILQTEKQFKDQIKAVNRGIPLGSLNPVFIPSLPSGPPNTMLFDKPPIDDPAVIHYSSSASTVPFHVQQMTMLQAQTSAFQQSISLMNLLNVPPASPKAPSRPANPPHQTLTPLPPPAKAMPSVFNEGTGKAWPDLMPGFQTQLIQRPSPWSPVSQQWEMPGVDERGADTKPADGTLGKSQPPRNSFEKIMACLSTMFPHYTRSVLTQFICEVRRVNDGSLSGLAYEEIIARVTELILDHQERTRVQFAASSHQQTSRPQSPRAPGAASPKPGSSAGHQTSRPSTPAGLGSPRAAQSASQAWRSPQVHPASAWDNQNAGMALDEDPCIICHEDLSPENTCVLECRHHFHLLCIKAWLRENRTCPTCRVHVLLPEDFPTLPGKTRGTNASPSF